MEKEKTNTPHEAATKEHLLKITAEIKIVLDDFFWYYSYEDLQLPFRDIIVSAIGSEDYDNAAGVRESALALYFNINDFLKKIEEFHLQLKN